MEPETILAHCQDIEYQDLVHHLNNVQNELIGVPNPRRRYSIRQCPGTNNSSFNLSSRFFYIPSRGKVSLFEKLQNRDSKYFFKKIDLELDTEDPEENSKVIQKVAILDCDVTQEVYAVMSNRTDLFVCNLTEVLQGDIQNLSLEKVTSSCLMAFYQTSEKGLKTMTISIAAGALQYKESDLKPNFSIKRAFGNILGYLWRGQNKDISFQCPNQLVSTSVLIPEDWFGFYCLETKLLQVKHVHRKEE